MTVVGRNLLLKAWIIIVLSVAFCHCIGTPVNSEDYYDETSDDIGITEDPTQEDEEEEHINMFIYGAMKRGEPDHDWLEDQANGCYKFIATGTTMEKFPMVITKPYNAPVVLNEPGKGNVIHGEIYDFDKKMFLKLDEIEGDTNFNVMQETNISYIPDDTQHKTMMCWMYVKFYYNKKLLQEKFISDYHSKGEHGMEFIKRVMSTPPPTRDPFEILSSEERKGIWKTSDEKNENNDENDF